MELPKANVGLTGVPKVEAVVGTACPKVKGAEFKAGVEVVAPKGNGLGGSVVALKLGAELVSTDDFPKVKVDCEVVAVFPNPPNEAVVLL